MKYVKIKSDKYANPRFAVELPNYMTHKQAKKLLNCKIAKDHSVISVYETGTKMLTNLYIIIKTYNIDDVIKKLEEFKKTI